MMWNNISGGACSSAMALLFPKIPCVIVNTGGNYPWAWKNVHKLQKKRIKVTVISSFQEGYPTYFDYIWKTNRIPFYRGCCYRGKELHLNKFYNTLHGKQIVNVGFCKGEERRAAFLKKQDTKHRIFNFPVLEYTREQLEKVCKTNSLEVKKTGCWFCPKQPNPPEWAVKAIISPEGQAERARVRGLLKEEKRY